MEEAISAADANRNFSMLLRRVREGSSFVVTPHGKPVARILPADTRGEREMAAHSALLHRLAKQPVIEVGRWSRDELYETEP